MTTLDLRHVFRVETAEETRPAAPPADLAQSLEREHERLRLALEAGQMRTIDWDLATNRTTVSGPIAGARGVWPSDEVADFEDRFLEIHPEDRAQLRGALQAAIAAGDDIFLTYRMLLPDGQVRWRELRGRVFRDVNGTAVHLTGVTADVSDRMRAAEELAVSERRFRAVFDHALDAMSLFDDEGRFVDANPAAVAMLGIPRADLLGRPLTSLIFRKGLKSAWSEFHRDGLRRGESSVRRADGTLLAIEYTATANVLPGRHLGVWRDIDARKRAERLVAFFAEASALLATSLDYETTLTSVTHLAVPALADWASIAMLQSDGTLKRVALAHADPAKVAAANQYWTRIPPEIRQTGAAAVARTGQAEVIQVRTEATITERIQDPELAAFVRSLGLQSSMSLPLRVCGELVGALSLHSAESGRRFGATDVALGEELARCASMAIANARAYQEAQEASRSKEEFLATISHELRTPLSAILGWAALLQTEKGRDVTALHRGLAAIERNARAQVRLIDDVLDVSRIAAGKLRLERTSLELGAVVSAALEAAAPAALVKGIELASRIDAPLHVSGDADRLQQVISNLISNALKFTPKHGRISVTAARQGDGVELRVEDTGEGISAELLPFVFDRFRQADGSSTRRHGGLGLGLAIARHLVEAHGGSIAAASEGAGQGATFTVSLPLEAGALPPAHRSAPPAVVAGSDALAGCTLLLCEADPDAREVVRELLGRHGADVVAVSSARDAIAVLEELLPHVLVSEVVLTEEDGHSLLRRVRALPAELGGATPAIALTAFTRPADVERALSAGFDRHLSKPVAEAALVAAVAELFAPSRPR